MDWKEASAKEDLNVEESFQLLVRKALRRKEKAEKAIKDKFVSDMTVNKSPIKLSLEEPDQNEVSKKQCSC